MDVKVRFVSKKSASHLNDIDKIQRASGYIIDPDYQCQCVAWRDATYVSPAKMKQSWFDPLFTTACGQNIVVIRVGMINILEIMAYIYPFGMIFKILGQIKMKTIKSSSWCLKISPDLICFSRANCFITVLSKKFAQGRRPSLIKTNLNHPPETFRHGLQIW